MSLAHNVVFTVYVVLLCSRFWGFVVKGMQYLCVKAEENYIKVSGDHL